MRTNCWNTSGMTLAYCVLPLTTPTSPNLPRQTGLPEGKTDRGKEDRREGESRGGGSREGEGGGGSQEADEARREKSVGMEVAGAVLSDASSPSRGLSSLIRREWEDEGVFRVMMQCALRLRGELDLVKITQILYVAECRDGGFVISGFLSQGEGHAMIAVMVMLLVLVVVVVFWAWRRWRRRGCIGIYETIRLAEVCALVLQILLPLARFNKCLYTCESRKVRGGGRAGLSAQEFGKPAVWVDEGEEEGEEEVGGEGCGGRRGPNLVWPKGQVRMRGGRTGAEGEGTRETRGSGRAGKGGWQGRGGGMAERSEAREGGVGGTGEYR
ncbi:hypothetical protein E2C01_007893 [Portunus trituberculatus]|uniref:Uncharacterized protein n=1 Tax=Portunus trituberculatus TaxID=210409 RepID=A0A5B7D068_PORTR|nr:hypothetical protein [Portunus trituberculatus]